jgi:hypothetical protein
MKVELSPPSGSLATRKWSGRCNQDFSQHKTETVANFRFPGGMKVTPTLLSRLYVT